MRTTFLQKCFYLTIILGSMFSNIVSITHAAPPNDETIAAIKRYSGSGGSCYRINPYLIGQDVHIEETDKQDIDLLHQYIQSNRLSQAMYVIRGISQKEAEYYKSQQGKIVDKHGFLSTIRKPKESFNSPTKLENPPKHMLCLKTDAGFCYSEPSRGAQNFLCQPYILLIYIPVGACALDISNYSESGNSELEVLLDYMSPLIIKEETTIGELLTEASERSKILKAFKERDSFSDERKKVFIAELK